MKPGLLFGLGCGFLIGTNLHNLLDESPKQIPQSIAKISPIPFTEDEIKLNSHQEKTRPVEMKLRIVDDETWKREITDPNTLAFTRPFLSPCEITLPAGWMILVEINEKYARWADSNNGHYIAHEILHCLRGVWHK